MKYLAKMAAFLALFFSIPCVVGCVVCAFQSEMDSSNFWAWGLIVTYPVLLGLSWKKIRDFIR